MLQPRPNRIATLALVTTLMSISWGLRAAPVPALTADQIIGRAVEKSAHPRPLPHSYSYLKKTLTEELNAQGKIKERKQKTWEVRLAPDHSYGRLVDVNGRPPSGSDLKNNSQNETNANEVLGPFKPREGGRSFLTADLVSRFDFSLAGDSQVNGRNAFQLNFQPKNPAPPRRRPVDRLLNNVTGTLWVDAEEFELAKAQVNLRSEVAFWGGLLGSLKKLAYTVTRTRVADGLWLNATSSGDFEGRKLFNPMHVRTSSKILDLKVIAGQQGPKRAISIDGSRH